jgi:branched-subunit amino acid aminotransferase/4-amino-4-deoxychorismate lyase
VVAVLARKAGLEVDACELRVDGLFAADEAFVTSTSLLVMPLVEVDGRTIRDGLAGPISRSLATALRQHLELD